MQKKSTLDRVPKKQAGSFEMSFYEIPCGPTLVASLKFNGKTTVKPSFQNLLRYIKIKVNNLHILAWFNRSANSM